MKIPVIWSLSSLCIFMPLQAISSGPPGLVTAYVKLPLAFEPNLGQADSSVQFLCRGRGCSLFLRSTDATLALRREFKGIDPQAMHYPSSILSSSTIFPYEMPGPSNLPISFGQDLSLPIERENVDVTLLRMKLVGNTSISKAQGEGPLPGKSNYFIGSDPSKWRTNVPQYSSVRLAGVYPGIDLVYYGNQGQLEYDFKVSPGANPQSIRWAVEGTDKIQVNADGNLILSAAGGNVVFKAPICYQNQGTNRKVIPSRYLINDNKSFSFLIDDYDRNRELVVDPALVYSTFLGGSNQDPSQGIAVDISGSAYVTGYTSSANFPVMNAYQNTLMTSIDTYISKFSPSGNALIFSTYLGGSANDYGLDIKVDNNGNAFITGATSSADFPVVNPFQGTFSATGANAFVTKLNSTGNALVYSTFLGGSKNDGAYGIAIDLTGNAYVVGVASSPNFPIVNAYQPTLSPGVQNAFLSKLNSAGNALVYSTYLGGNNQEKGFGVAVNPIGEAYVVGTTWSSNFPVVNAFQSTLLGTQNAFVTKFNSAGNSLLYSTYLGGSNGENGSSIALDLSGSAYVVGLTASSDFPTVGAYDGSLHGGGSTWDTFLTKFNPAGNGLLYSTYFGGTSSDIATAVAVDLSGCAYVTGRTYSTDLPLLNAIQSSFSGVDDIFVAKFNAAGNGLLYSTYLGGNNYDEANALALDNAGNAFIAGTTQSPDFPTVNPFQAVYTGGAFGQNGFVTKISDVVPTSTPTNTETPVVSPTPTGTQTASWTATISFTASPTASPTPTVTESPSSTLTWTPSPLNSYTATPTPTSSASTTVSPTVTPTVSGSASPSVTETATVTITQVVSLTITETPSFTPSVTVSAGVPFSQNPPTIVSTVMVPNPITKNQGALVIQLLGNAQQVLVDVYSPGYSHLMRQVYSNVIGPGYATFNIDSSLWPSGLLYLKVAAMGHGGQSVKITKVFVIR